MDVPWSHRLLLLAYPRWFRSEYGIELTRHLASQRAEGRYSRPLFGTALFWRDACFDAVVTGVTLRAEGPREWFSGMWLGTKRSGGYRAEDDDHRLKREGWGMMLDGIMRDIRHALRALRKNPGYAAVFIVTLGLGIGANTAIFSAVNGVLLRPLPHNDGDRLVYLRHAAPRAGIENALFSVMEIEDYRQASPSLGEVAEFSAMTFTMLGYDTPRRVRAGIVTGNYFGVMGLTATLGRTVGPEDDGEGAPAVIVLSDAYWRSVFGGDPAIIGTTVEVNGLIATFVGVAEAAPPYPERTDIYVNLASSPHHLDASMTQDRIHRMTEVFARLAPRATAEMAGTEADAITMRLHAEYPESYDEGSGFEVTVTPLKTQLTARARPTLLLLLGTAFFVLIIACANLANLTLTRVLRRDHELAIRVSLGASKRSLRRGLLVESLVLAGAGALLGLLMAFVSLDLLVAFAGRFTSRASEITFDTSVFGVALMAAVGASLFFTALPRLPGGDSVGGSLTRSGNRSIGSGAKRAQRILVVAQIGTSFVLLIGAGLLLRTMNHLNEIDPGFDTDQVLTMSVPPSFYGSMPAELTARYLSILRDVRALPGVQGASLTSGVPFRSAGSNMMEMDVEGGEVATGAVTPRADFRVVSADYFMSMGIDVLSGREFVSTDVEDAQKVVVINQSMAQDYFGERDPIGRRIKWTEPSLKFLGMLEEWRTVVGVVADTRDAGLDADVRHTMYNPYQQVTPFYTGDLIVRVAGDPSGVLPRVRDVVLSYDPNQPIDNVATIAELNSESIAPRKLNTLLLSGFALLALVIAAVGIGGVLAFSVGSRIREFGVRSALGAAQHQVWSGVLVEGATLAALGVLVGSFGAFALTRFMAGLLVGVPALDPITFVAVGVLLAGVAVIAAWVPAWRAAKVSPMEALRTE